MLGGKDRHAALPRIRRLREGVRLGGAALAVLLSVALPLKAEGERAGQFDYYVMALSWSSGWCASEGDHRDAPQCESGKGLSFVLHGLWPQYEKGWPSYCRTTARDPKRSETAKMEDILGSAGSAFYQWKKHGRCSGLSAQDYFKVARQAYEKIALPEVFAGLRKSVKLPASVVEAAFLEANPQMTADQITVTCAADRIDEVRICLDKDLNPRRCGMDVSRDCRMKDALMEAVR